MSAPSGYRAPEKCADCGTPAPAFVRERRIPGQDRRQAEFECAECGLVHIVSETKKGKGGDK